MTDQLIKDIEDLMLQAGFDVDSHNFTKGNDGRFSFFIAGNLIAVKPVENMVCH